MVPQLHKHPGPGTYEGEKLAVRTSYSMRPRSLDMIDNNLSYKQTPGPGTYREVDLDPERGRFRISNYADSKFGTINPKTPRFKKMPDSPSPFNYREGDNLSDKAKYVLSTRKGQGTRAFCHE
eukprot:GHVR01068248.1.p1 GENE.GHVR01068248.1~~GHVR01068248.1.p1  ORF type:complete len:123 (+),score=0.70 GHVR01068248.1:1158-1526(+)